MGTWKAVADALVKAYHESPRFMAVMCIICAGLLFLPSRILAPLSVEPMVTQYRPYLGIAFLFSLVMTLSYPIQKGSAWAFRSVRGFSRLRSGKARLHALDRKEKAALSSYILQDIRTQHFSYDNGTIATLQRCGILLCPRQWVRTDKAPFAVAEWAWDYLKKHPELLK